MTPVEIYWDVASPYTYLCITQLEALRSRTGATVILRPFLLGGVFKATGNTMPAALPVKARYMREDLRLWRDYYGVPLRLPPDEVIFPINSLLPMRAAVAADLEGAGEPFCLAMFQRYWGAGNDISKPEEILLAADEAGLDGKALLAAAARQDVKDGLRRNTDEAVSRGAFGAPAIFVGETLLWGTDRLVLVEHLLQRQQPAH